MKHYIIYGVPFQLDRLLVPLLARGVRTLLICTVTSLIGSFPDAQLPSKRIIGPKNYEFLTSKREEFQEYLQVETLRKKTENSHSFHQGCMDTW